MQIEYVAIAGVVMSVIVFGGYMRTQLRGVFYKPKLNAVETASGNTSVHLTNKHDVFLANLSINDKIVSVVVDTGSSDLLVATQHCKRCLGGGGGVINVKSNDATDTITFGTQRDTMRWIKLPVCFAEDTCSNTKINLGAVMARTGTSNLNVMGMSPTGGVHSFVRQLGAKYVAITMNYKAGLLEFGNTVPRRLTTAGVLPPPMNFLPSPGSRVDTCVRVNNFYINGEAIHGIHLVCVDTGSNVVSFPEREKTNVKRALRKRPRTSVEFMAKGGVKQTLSVPPSLSVKYHDVQEDSYVVVMGTPCMMGKTLLMDIETKSMWIV